MPFQLSKVEIMAATVHLPRYGVWTARVTLAKNKDLAIGSTQTMLIGDLTFSGTIRSGGTYVNESEYYVIGGADGWRKSVKNRNYRADNGVSLKEVANDLASEAKEKLTLESGVDKSLGYAWTRPSGTASAALNDLGVKWWVSPDGITHVGDRPASTVSTKLKFALEAFDPSYPRAVIGIPNDTLSPFQPGATITGQGFPSAFTSASTDIKVSDRKVSIEMWGT